MSTTLELTRFLYLYLELTKKQQKSSAISLDDASQCSKPVRDGGVTVPSAEEYSSPAAVVTSAGENSSLDASAS